MPCLVISFISLDENIFFLIHLAIQKHYVNKLCVSVTSLNIHLNEESPIWTEISKEYIIATGNCDCMVLPNYVDIIYKTNIVTSSMRNLITKIRNADFTESRITQLM